MSKDFFQSTDELWSKGLCRLQNRFEEFSQVDDSFRALLVESVIPRQSSAPDKPRLENFCDDDVFRIGGTSYQKEPMPCIDENGHVQFTSKPMLDATGKPVTNSAGEPIKFELGASRTLYVAGTFEHKDQFDTLVGQAGRTIAGIPNAIQHRIIERESIYCDNDFERWIWVLFDLAWRQPAGTLLAAEKYAWYDPPDKQHGHCSINLASVSLIRKDKTFENFLKEIEDPPQQWYSTLTEIVSKSVSAIDFLLGIHSKQEWINQALRQFPTLIAALKWFYQRVQTGADVQKASQLERERGTDVNYLGSQGADWTKAMRWVWNRIDWDETGRNGGELWDYVKTEATGRMASPEIKRIVVPKLNQLDRPEVRQEFWRDMIMKAPHIVEELMPDETSQSETSVEMKDFQVEEGEWSAPMSLAEMARRITGKAAARSREVKSLLERYGLRHVDGRKYQVRLDDEMEPNIRRKIESTD